MKHMPEIGTLFVGQIDQASVETDSHSEVSNTDVSLTLASHCSVEANEQQQQVRGGLGTTVCPSKVKNSCFKGKNSYHY